MLREMSTRYGRTPGGYLWALLEPIGGLIAMTLVFSMLLRAPQLGNSFVLFFASGYLPFVLYVTIAQSVQGAITFSKPLLRYPALSWIDAVLARLLLNLLTGVLVMVIVFVGLLQMVSVTAIFEFGPMVLSTALACLLATGIGVLNCVLIGLYPVWGKVWGMATRPIFIIAGVFFLFENLPPNLQAIGWYTPWIHFTALFRSGVYPSYEPDFISVPLLLIWALVPLCLGLLLLRRHYLEILNR